jgi:hypothetical protein
VQLMKAGFFPGTVKDPRTAFSFEMLRRFHIASLESKEAACNYVASLRRLTDNSQTATVPVRGPLLLIFVRLMSWNGGRTHIRLFCQRLGCTNI